MKQKDILQLESSDMRQAYLFEENGRWYAYEHSANRIEKFMKGFADFKHKIHDVCGRFQSRNQPRYTGQMSHYLMRRYDTGT